MIQRNTNKIILDALQKNAAVALMGPRQIGKTTLALEIADKQKAIYRDLENPRHLSQVQDIELFLEQYPDQLLILDEVQRAPEIFAPLRGIIDERRRTGWRNGQFLFLGSASLDLLGQTSESLAGRISYIELAGINVLELDESTPNQNSLWLRGGYPESLLAPDNLTSLQWRQNLIRTYLERDIPQFGFRIPAETLRRFWTMLAHHQGGILNAASLAKGLGISGQSVAKYLDILVDLLLVRRLAPWHANVGKRLVKSPKIHIRDSGLLHALLDIEETDDLLGHPVLGHSWEGFIIENLIGTNSIQHYRPYYYRTHAGAEIDLLLERGGKPEIAIEVKRSSSPKIGKGFNTACTDLNVKHRYVVYPGNEPYRLSRQVWASPLPDLMRAIQNQSGMSFGE